MNTDQLKDRMASLPEGDQDTLAQLALLDLKKRTRLEKTASGSTWNKVGLIFPIIVSGAFFGFRRDLADYLPFIIIFLLFVIQATSASAHSRIDAIYELIKVNQRGNGVRETEAKHYGAPNHSSAPTLNSASSVRGSEDL